MGRLSTLLCVIALALACREPPPTDAAADASDAFVNRFIHRTDLGTLGGRSSVATDINDDGIVVGWSENASGVHRAFRWTAQEAMRDLGTLPGHEWSRAVSITPDGRILGVSGTGRGFAGTSVVWSSSGAIAELAIPLLPGAEWSEPVDFNEYSEVVGWDVVVLQHAWSWRESRGKIDITASVPEGSFEGAANAINASGLVVGANHAGVCVRSPTCWHAFLWSFEEGYRDIGTPSDDPDVTLVGYGVNDRGTVVGSVMFPPGPQSGLHPYRWSERHGFTLLPTHTYGYATAIDRWGTAVGGNWDPEHQKIQATAWAAFGGLIELSPDDPHSHVAIAINDAGAAVGWRSLESGERRAMLWTVGRRPRAPRVTARRESTPLLHGFQMPSDGDCLSNAEAIVSRAALLSCVLKDEQAQK